MRILLFVLLAGAIALGGCATTSTMVGYNKFPTITGVMW